jgi:hypothetical protein
MPFERLNNSKQIKCLMPFTVSVDVLRPCLKLSGPDRCWAGGPMGNLSINRRSELGVCEKPITPVDLEYLRK